MFSGEENTHLDWQSRTRERSVRRERTAAVRSAVFPVEKGKKETGWVMVVVRSTCKVGVVGVLCVWLEVEKEDFLAVEVMIRLKCVYFCR